jgi:hypothetical protein
MQYVRVREKKYQEQLGKKIRMKSMYSIVCRPRRIPTCRKRKKEIKRNLPAKNANMHTCT